MLRNCFWHSLGTMDKQEKANTWNIRFFRITLIKFILSLGDQKFFDDVFSEYNQIKNRA